MMRVLLGGMISGGRFYYLLVPDVTHKPLWFLGYMAIVLAIFWVVGSSRFTMNYRGFLVPNPACRYTTSILGRRQNTR